MANAREYKNAIQPNWCPGCGDFGIQMAIQEVVRAASAVTCIATARIRRTVARCRSRRA